MDESIDAGHVTRLYLLDDREYALCIEVWDAQDAHHLTRYSKIVDEMSFAS